jgi:transposase InsO family protein
LFGKTRQAWYYKQQQDQSKSEEYFIIYHMVEMIRKDLPKIGTRKLYHMLKEQLAEYDITIGRDKLFDLLREWGMLIKKRRRAILTTHSHHWLRKYPNLIAQKQIYKSNQVWVSDITYIQIKGNFAYLSLLTDAYSRKILGHYLSENLSREGPIKALKIAISQKGKSYVTHHSDRGIQYCCKDYVDILNDSFIKISMTENGSPYENAIAERVNGILKHEFACNQTFGSFTVAKNFIARAIKNYNGIRPHMSCSYLTPNIAHETEETVTRKWKSYYKEKVK